MINISLKILENMSKYNINIDVKGVHLIKISKYVLYILTKTILRALVFAI